MADLTEKAKPSTLENGSDSSHHGDKSSALFQNTDDTELPDPDAGKSPEERAKIVRECPCWLSPSTADTSSRTEL